MNSPALWFAKSIYFWVESHFKMDTGGMVIPLHVCSPGRVVGVKILEFWDIANLPLNFGVLEIGA